MRDYDIVHAEYSDACNEEVRLQREVESLTETLEWGQGDEESEDMLEELQGDLYDVEAVVMELEAELSSLGE